MTDEERLLQWLLAAGGNPEGGAPHDHWHRLLQEDPAWRHLAGEIRRWDEQLERELVEGPLPQEPPDRLRRQLLELVASAQTAESAPAPPEHSGVPSGESLADVETARGSKRPLRRRFAWQVAAAAAVAVVLVVAWWLWPPAAARLARSGWKMLQTAEFRRPERWHTRDRPDQADEVPLVVRVSRRVRWRPVQLGRWRGVVHHLMNHETQSTQAWLFVFRGVLESVPAYPPKQPQWRSPQAVGGCWFDPAKRRTYVLIVPGTQRQYRFWITSGPLAELPRPLPEPGASWAKWDRRESRSPELGYPPF